MLAMAKAGKYNGYLLEGMGCPGGCVAGAGTITPVKKSTTAVAAYMQTSCSQSALESPVAQRLEELERLEDEAEVN